MTAPLRVGSLCSGYGGLEMGAELVLGPLEHVWHGEYDKAASKVLEARWPRVLNLGDIAAVTAGTSKHGTWADQAPIDLLCAGYPCQPFSSAGLRKGLDDPRNRWPDVLEAIRALRPRLVFLENVRGHLNRGFDTVVASLAASRYVGSWRCVRASDAGAAHKRERLFIVAWPAEEAAPWLRGNDAPVPGGELTLLPTPMSADGERQSATFSRSNPTLLGAPLPTPTAERAGYNQGGAAGRVGPIRPSLDQIDRLLPTPRTSDANGAGQHGDGGMDLRTAVSLLPTPRARDGKGRDPNPRGVDLNEAIHLLPTPMAADGGHGRGSSAGYGLRNTVRERGFWGDYAPAIERWASVIGRPAPNPTEPGQNGRPRLSPLFVEWLMGLPAGHVTDIITKRGDALRILGNGVVRQAAALALRQLLTEPAQPDHVQPDLFEAVAA